MSAIRFEHVLELYRGLAQESRRLRGKTSSEKWSAHQALKRLAELTGPGDRGETLRQRLEACTISTLQEPAVRDIPCLGRTAPPDGFSHPIDGSILSRALAGFAHFDRLISSYGIGTPLLMPGWSGPGYPVLRLTYTNFPLHIRAKGGGEPSPAAGAKWHAEILIVPEPDAEKVRSSTQSVGLPLLYRWMTGPDAPTAQTRRRSMELWWFPESSTMELRNAEPNSH